MGIAANDWPKFLSEIESQVIQGHHQDVKIALQKLNLKQIPRAFAAPIGEVAWRISEPLITLKILNRFVFPENSFELKPSDKEKFVYATALANLGAVDEAIDLFNSINDQSEPEVNLRKSMAYFRVWNYPAAIPLLKNFLQQQNVSPYRKLIGKVNLAAALVVDSKFPHAQSLLREIQAECTDGNYLLLLGNCYELQAQCYFLLKDFDLSLAHVEKSIELLKNQGGEFALFAEKWKVICEAFKNNDSQSLQNLKTFNQKAILHGQWETARECDLFEAVLTQTEELARKVIMGTPFEYYRQRARGFFLKNIVPQGHFDLILGSVNSKKPSFVFNPYEIQNGIEGLHSKPQLLSFFEALTMDFYKPNHIGLLFQRIYKNEKFNPFTSPKRVLSLIKRLNDWFIDNKVPLRVRMKKSEFALITDGSVSVRVSIHRAKNLSKNEGQLTTLKLHFKDRTFSTQNVASKLEISKSSAQTLIFQAIEQGHVSKKGTGRATTYTLISRNRKKSAA